MSTSPLPPSIQTKAHPGPAPGGLGRGLFASTDIPTGDNILHIQSPFTAVLDTQRLEDTCSGCFGRRQLENEGEIVLKACTGCQVVKYCDKTCQANDWKFAHSLECAIFRNLKPRVLPNNARAILRMVLRFARGKYNAQELELFQQLETHIREIREENPAQWGRIALSSKAVKEYSGTDMKEEVISVFGAKLDINSFNLTNATYDRIGLYLHPYAALINHSCDSNAIVGFDGETLFIKALRPIRHAEQIFISYVDATNPTHIRKKELGERYFFDCQCPKCTTTDTKEGKTPHLPPEIETKVYALLDSASTSADPKATAAAAAEGEEEATLQTALNLLHSHSCPITAQPSVSLRDNLIATLLAAGKFNSAFIHAAIRHSRIDPVVYPQKSHPLRAVHAWTLAKLAIHFSYPEQGGGAGADPEPVSLEDSGVNFGVLAWSVLSGLVADEEGSCTVPGFRGLVRRVLGEVDGEFRRGGLDPRGVEMREEIRRVWGVVGEVIGGYK